MKEGKGIMLEDGSIDITHLMDDKDIEIWEDIFKVKGRHKKRGKRFVKSLFKSSGGTEMILDEAKAMLRFMIYNPVTEEEAEAIEVVLEALAE